MSKPDKTVDRFWDMPLRDLLARLEANPAGLTSAEAKRRLRVYGPNSLLGESRFAALVGFLRFFANPLVLILLAASAISIVLRDPVGGTIIIAIVLLSVMVNFYVEFQARHAVEDIRKQVATTAAVLRDGHELESAHSGAGSRRRRPAQCRGPGAGRRPSAGRQGPARARVCAHRGILARRQGGGRSSSGATRHRRRPQQRFPGDRRANGNRHRGHRSHRQRHRLRRDCPAAGHAAAGDRIRPRHTPLRADDHAGDHAAGALRPAGEHRLASSAAGIVPVLGGACRRDDAGDDADDHHDHAGAGGAADGHERRCWSSSFRRSRTSEAWRFSAATRRER